MVSEGLTRAGLASRLGVSRAWVTKVLGADEGLPK
jgi:transcriptional regulator with XRE-family HTH domain